jgi:hypothetical protein
MNSEQVRILKGSHVVYYKILPGGQTEENHVRIAGIPAKIPTEYLLNVNQLCLITQPQRLIWYLKSVRLMNSLLSL